jgi:hypothetical protein
LRGYCGAQNYDLYCSYEDLPFCHTETLKNQISEARTNVGEFGGSCTCPHGNVYWVGDNQDWCGSLACYDGIPGECNKTVNAKWAHRKVVCGRKTSICKRTTAVSSGFSSRRAGSTYDRSNIPDECICETYRLNTEKGRQATRCGPLFDFTYCADVNSPYCNHYNGWCDNREVFLDARGAKYHRNSIPKHC